MPKKPTKNAGSRPLHVKVKTSDKRSISSTRWLQRQLNDPYVIKARAEGYRSRAAFKLLELDERFHLLKPGGRVVDLGCAPGGWAQVAVAKVGPTGTVVGCDLLAVDAVPGAVLIVQDFLADDAVENIKALLLQADIPPPAPPASGGDGGPSQHRASGEAAYRASGEALSPPLAGGAGGGILSSQAAPQSVIPSVRANQGLATLVMSDMAANTTGHAPTDHIRIMNLCELAYLFACEVLAPGGAFVCKVLKGGTERELLKLMQRDFTTVKHAKPAASRQDSAESYVVAMGFRG